MTFSGFVDATGKLTLDDRRGFLDYTRRFSGKEVVVTVTRKTRQRSAQQNKWLWGCAYPLIAEHCGYDEHEHEQLHYDLLSVRFGTVAVQPLVPGAPPRIVPAFTSSQLTTTDMAAYMEWLVRFAAEKFGVVIPLPDERNGKRAA